MTSQTENPKTRLSYRKRVFFSLLSTVLFFVALEGMLALFCVQPTLVDRDPFVGFESSVPLFVEQRQGDQIVARTAANKLSFFNAQSFPSEKADNTIRVFCLGGSTTFGRPYDDRTSFAGWLREMLPLADGDRNWEVINAGGVSYASYRVAAVMDELVHYSPDLFIVYTGHNEFLEERTYRRLQSQPPMLRQLSAALHQSRTFSLAHRMLATDDSISQQGSVLPGEVDTILDHSVGPDAYHRDDRLRANVLAHLEFNLNRMVETARTAGARLVFVTPSSNLKDFSPLKSQHREAMAEEDRQRWSQMFYRAREQAGSGDSAAALLTLETAAEIDRERADLHFEIGKNLQQQGHFPEARNSFQRAIDLDVCPLRALADVSRMIEEVAVAKRAALVDFDSILASDCRSRYGHDSPGNEYFVDHVHPTIESHRLLALAIINAMARTQMLTLDHEWGEASIALASRRIESRVDVELQSRALTNLAQVLSWAGKQEEAGPIAAEANRLRSERQLDEDPESLFYAAVGYALKGLDGKAITLLQRVVELQPGNAQARWRLAALLYDQFRYEESREHFHEAIRLDPLDAYSHQMLGLLLIKFEQYEEALVVFSRASELEPENPYIRDGITTTLRQLGRG
jgi:tetratricopeptide (TPR) repeat protein